MRFLRRVIKLKTLCLSCTVLTLLILFLGTMAALLPAANEQTILSVRREMTLSATSPKGTFTLIMQTYNRTDLLLKMLNHYQAMPGLSHVIVVWNNVGQEPPQDVWKSFGPHPVPVTFKKQSTNLMRNRLQRFSEIKTEAVLMMDDDTLVSAYDVSFAFSIWQEFPDRIAGFVPRKHVLSPSGVYSYGSFELKAPHTESGDMYSMILIGAAFFHRDYLQLFEQLPVSIHNMIDQTQNCDDIAINFIVANHTRKSSGVLVKPTDMRNLEKEAGSGYTGMWHRAEHLLQRSYCLNRLAQIYGTMPLKYSSIMISQFGFPNYANHKSKI
ncbi:hypothetical protein GDO86_007640 [Hymenochirus boettgeri]|uniref:Exostosin-like 2 n=1 Tax=Hymenochirus boettgeri TaxID=247094 RepID=A0A8T2J003_9PIPI|nr:hypothetical protein GDO86_007640 [Hymenochirus boettgeri]KAG8436607.1 hypothetical protein GDO86_007640 [Hymenochirus boettgeri]KAG8436608.1 hypothetical protein GDO86_007640 [Hymenochirus boettgeri]